MDDNTQYVCRVKPFSFVYEYSGFDLQADGHICAHSLEIVIYTTKPFI